MKNLMFFSWMAFFLINQTQGQVYTNKVVGEKNDAYKDSLKINEYPYSLPILGKQVTAKGYDLPYPAGVSVQYFWQKSDIIIDNLMVGFNNGEMTNLDGIVRFDKAIATASALTVRPDVWVLPFLNVYAILGRSQASTEVGFGVWVPDSTGIEQEILSAGTVVDFKSTSAGFGLTPTIGVGGGFLALDMNMAWTDVPQLDKPTFTFVFGPRLGKSFKFKNHPQSNIAVWAGGFRVKLNSETNGSIALSDVFPEDGELQAQIDQGIEKVADAQEQVDSWWNNLTPPEQSNPVNKAKYESANKILSSAGEILNAADMAVNNISNSTVQYSMDKRPKDKWNFIVGSQYQINKHFMIRGEFGFLSSRTQFMAGLQYRFGI
jgi:hypothetical protein